MMGLHIPECMVQVNNKYDSSIFICVSFVKYINWEIPEKAGYIKILLYPLQIIYEYVTSKKEVV